MSETYWHLPKNANFKTWEDVEKSLGIKISHGQATLQENGDYKVNVKIEINPDT